MTFQYFNPFDNTPLTEADFSLIASAANAPRCPNEHVFSTAYSGRSIRDCMKDVEAFFNDSPSFKWCNSHPFWRATMYARKARLLWTCYNDKDMDGLRDAIRATIGCGISCEHLDKWRLAFMQECGYTGDEIQTLLSWYPIECNCDCVAVCKRGNSSRATPAPMQRGEDPDCRAPYYIQTGFDGMALALAAALGFGAGYILKSLIYYLAQ